MPRLLVVYGTRPEAIKLAPVVLAVRAAGLDVHVCVSGQHRELLDEPNRLFGIVPDRDLELLRADQRPEALLTRAVDALAGVCAEVRPDAVVVQGDTTTTMAAALSAFYARVPVAHVEAGLRTGNLDAPFPEELHRQVVARVAHWHFAPTAGAAQNLAREGIVERVWVTGNTAIDALRLVRETHGEDLELVRELGLDDGARWILVTAHRRESAGEPFDRICEGMRAIVDAHDDLRILYALHPNPSFRAVAERRLGDHPRVRLVPALGFARLVTVLSRVWAVMTDSGGLQEEAPEWHKPVLVMREESDRPEAIEAGTAVLVGRDPARMAAAIADLRDPAIYARMASGRNPFGDGHAARRIVERLAQDLRR